MNRVSFEQRELPYDIAEEMKTLRTNIQFSGEDKKVVMLTSWISGEGKSTLALQLAMSFAELKKKVVLVDCDLRKSVLVKQLQGGAVSKGMSHFLSGQCEFSEVLCATNIPGLAAVFAGVVPPDPTELLAGPAFQRMIDTLRDAFDYVIIDCAPIGMVVDASIVAPKCDGSILVLEFGTIKKRLAQEAKRKLERTGTSILGVVLNKVDVRKDGKYYGKYYGNRYTKYYKHEN